MELVLVGRSNVGKSSIIKQLTGRWVLIGRRPGVTKRTSRYRWGKIDVVDMPGFGFMAGVPREVQEKIKTEIIRYLEENRKRISLALEIIDARAFSGIVERWESRGQIPVDVEMFSFLQELKLNPVVVVNKVDLIYPEERDAVLDHICDKLNMPPPWRQWPDIVVPVSAKTGENIPRLRKLVENRLKVLSKERLLAHLKHLPPSKNGEQPEKKYYREKR
ncbi:MAG TPA: GTP-binding protein EngB [Hadesarchaea archaeon]|nr:GTP-binding protein EngB [Hadesarchaea archaeon]